MYTKAAPMYSRDQTASLAMSFSAFLKIVKAMYGSLPREDWTGFGSSRSRLFLSNRVCPATLLSLCSQPPMGAFGSALTRV